MVLFRVLPFTSLLLCAATATDQGLLECGDRENARLPVCTQPLEDVVPVTPGGRYTAKIRCFDCPYTDWEGADGSRERVSMNGDVDMLYVVALSHDNHSVLLNNEPFFPHLRTIPTPPKLWLPRVRPGFSYTNLSSLLTCPTPSCRTRNSRRKIGPGCSEWCYDLRLDEIQSDYAYTAKETEYEASEANAEAQYWEFTIDAIGASAGHLDKPTWGFDNPSQKMLRIVVEGIESGKQKYTGEKDMQAGSSLFGPFGEEEKVYDYSIREVSVVERSYKFPPRKALSFRQRVSRFFGNDVWEEESHRLVFISSEWGQYGKEGTLRNSFGVLIHWYLWPLVLLIVFSVVGGLTTLYGMYRLFFWVQAQRELMRWNGMDNVWDNLRREREEEENRLLDGSYRDEPDEGGSPRPSRYTDDVDTMKPLPAKPLPDKPLPEVPLIDA